MNDDLHHLAAAYALDALDDAERVQFEAHFPDCERCQTEIAEFRDVGAAMAAAESSPPPEALRDRVLAQIDRTPQLPPDVAPAATAATTPADELAVRRGRTRWPRIGLAAAAALVLLVGVLGIAQLADDGLTADDVVSSPDAVVTTLASTQGDGSLQVVWSAELERVVVIGDELADPGAEMAYALWALSDGEASPAALFVPDADGEVTASLGIGELRPDAWGITIEPASGSAQPTTPILYTGSI